jgi:hypothetical protein
MPEHPLRNVAAQFFGRDYIANPKNPSPRRRLIKPNIISDAPDSPLSSAQQLQLIKCSPCSTLLGKAEVFGHVRDPIREMRWMIERGWGTRKIACAISN